MNNSLGDKLRSLRLKTRKTLREQGVILGVSMNSIYRWEHNLTAPRRPKLIFIANYYNVPFEWLIAEDSSASVVSESELGLLSMFRQLPAQGKYKVLGYVERMALEDAEEYDIEDYIWISDSLLFNGDTEESN